MKPLPVSKDGPPRQLGRFELVAELASGGMATVYLGRLGGAGGFQRFVAIKRLHSHLANDAEFVDMFLDEARLAARLHHPNVVPILEIGTSERGYYLVMEYVEGETLARLLNLSHQAGSPVPVNVTVRVFLDVLAGLHAAHELVGDDGRALEIVHRDVSPQNVLVGVEGAAKLTDFGVAHAADRLAHTRTGQLKGKFSYMAPEQALGYSVDRRADVFAVGTCLWEALACKRLFKGDTEADTLEKVLRGPIPRLRSIVPGVHPVIEEVVARALHRDRDQRLGSAAQFAEALELAATQAGVLGTQRDVAAHVQRVLGPLLTQQRDAIRQWIVGMEQQRPLEMDIAETRGPEPRGPATRVERAPRRDSGAQRAAAAMPTAARPEPSLLAMVGERPTAQQGGAPPSDDSAESSVVAIGAVERSTVSHVTQPRSSSVLPTLGIAALLIAGGVAIGVTRLNSTAAAADGDVATKGEPKAAPSGQAGHASKLAPPPVPTTPIGTPLVAATGAQPGPVGIGPQGPTGFGLPVATTVGVGAPPPPAPPPVPTTPIGALIPAAPAGAPTGSPPPTVAINELPAAPRAAPRPASRPAPARASEPRGAAEEPRPRRSEPREPRGSSDDDIGRNPYR